METRLAHARRQITLEQNSRKLVERQRDALESQLDQIRILVTADDEGDIVDDDIAEDAAGRIRKRRRSILKTLTQGNSK